MAWNERRVLIAAHARLLEGDLVVPEGALGLVIFAHGSGSDRYSARHRHAARVLNGAGLATLLLDLLTVQEEMSERWSLDLRFDIDMLASRLLAVRAWSRLDEETQFLPIGYFGASTGTAAALVAAARHPEGIHAIASRGGRTDLAEDVLELVLAPTLLIVGGDDGSGLEVNQRALGALRTPRKSLRIVPGASSSFEEPGTLEETARLAADWFAQHFRTLSEPSVLGWTDPQGRWI